MVDSLPCCGALRSTSFTVEGEGNYRDTEFGRCRNCGKTLFMSKDGLKVDEDREIAEKERRRQAALPFHGEDR